MRHFLYILGFGALASGALAFANVKPQAEVSLTRLDCGRVEVRDLNAFSDTDSYPGQSKTLVSSCYLIRHGEDVMIWDTGFPVDTVGKPIDPAPPMDGTMTVTLVDQLARLGLKPADVDVVAVSHLHGDHTGQIPEFPNAKLLIGKGDWAAISAPKPDPRIDITPFTARLKDRSKVDAVDGERDIFGDGTVTMIDLPGHTPGHHALLVKLAKTGNVLLSGDTAHFNENYASDGVPDFNVDRAQSIAALERFKKLAAEQKALVIIQHEPADVAKLPKFPESAR